MSKTVWKANDDEYSEFELSRMVTEEGWVLSVDEGYSSNSSVSLTRDHLLRLYAALNYELLRTAPNGAFVFPETDDASANS